MKTMKKAALLLGMGSIGVVGFIAMDRHNVIEPTELVKETKQAVSAMKPRQVVTGREGAQPQAACTCCSPSSKEHDAHEARHPMGLSYPVASLEELPESALRDALASASPQDRTRALAMINELEIPELDFASLHLGARGGLYYTCRAPAAHALPVQEPASFIQSSATTTGATVPIANPPVYHSNEGAAMVLYLDFNGALISNTGWNIDSDLEAQAWTMDADDTTFSEEEQTAIRRIWKRVSEDYAPFDINVTTDPAFDPEVTGGSDTIGWVLITKDVDRNGLDMPAPGYGGVAYVNVFNSPYYDYANFFSPAFVYANNLGPNNEQYIADAAAHEFGHNLGLSHHGIYTESEQTGYYAGHEVAGGMKWAPIMGAGYNADLTTWSHGEYHGANNSTQDDIAMILEKVPYRADDVTNESATAKDLYMDEDLIVDPLTHDYVGDDANEGIISDSSDVDRFRFSTVGGDVTLTANPFAAEVTQYGWGMNLDILMTLYDESGTVLATVDDPEQRSAELSMTLEGGTYYLTIEGTGAGDPLAADPTGFTAYGSLGMYFISGIAPQTLPPTPAEEWRMQYFGYCENTDDAADACDYDKDGLVNILERAFGSVPTDSGCCAKPTRSIMEDAGSTYLVFSYRRIAGGIGTTAVNYTADDLVYEVQYTDDPLSGTWNSGDVTIISIEPGDSGTETVTVRLNTSLEDQSRQFVRLSVEPLS